MHINSSSCRNVRDLPIGIDATGVRRESDAMGEIEVPADRYWGAQTQRSLIHFAIGEQRMPKAIYHAMGYVKKAAALRNKASCRMDDSVGCDMFRRYVIEGAQLDDATIDTHLRRSLMLVTALSPEIGYDKATEIAQKASAEGSTLKQATLDLGYLDADRFDEVTDPKRMTGTGVAGA